MHATDALQPGVSTPIGPGAVSAWRGALLLTAVVLVARVVYLVWLCPYDLGEDEAFYWEWSKHLDWSYYSKGPGIAWALYASTSVLGDTDLGVRVVAVIASGLGMLACAGLAIDVARDHGAPPGRSALLASAMFVLAPGIQAAGLLSTIDGPYMACWALAAWAGYRSLRPGAEPPGAEPPGAGPWAALGAALALGVIFKYTILLLSAGVALAALFTRGEPRRAPLRRGHVALALAIALLGLVPIVIWNARNDWGTVRHLLGAVGLPGGDRPTPPTATSGSAAAAWSYNPKWTLEMLAAQAGLVGPMLGLMLLALARHPARAYFAWACAPILLFYLALTFLSSGEGNWPLAGFVTLIPLAAASLAGAGWNARAPRALWNITLAFGLVAGLGMLRLDLVQRALEPLSPALARAIPLHRLDGARELASGVQTLAAGVRSETGAEPFIITSHYGVASQLAFYLPGHPTVRCAMSRVGGRRVQQDFWPEHSLDVLSLRGRPAILIGGVKSGRTWARAFDRVVPAGERGEPRIPGEPRRDRWGFIGYGYRGWDAPPATALSPAASEPGSLEPADGPTPGTEPASPSEGRP